MGRHGLDLRLFGSEVLLGLVDMLEDGWSFCEAFTEVMLGCSLPDLVCNSFFDCCQDFLVGCIVLQFDASMPLGFVGDPPV